MSRDVVLQCSNKLAGEWSASSVAGLLSQPALEALSSQQKWDALEPLVRARLLLSPMFLRLKELEDLRAALDALRKVGISDRDEWVRVVAASVGPYDGRLHMDDVVKESKLVGSTLEDVRQMGAGVDPSLFRPREEKYLSPAILEQRWPGGALVASEIPKHTHFQPRDPSTAPKGAQDAYKPLPVVAHGVAPSTSGVDASRLDAALKTAPGRPPIPPVSRGGVPSAGGPPRMARRPPLPDDGLFLNKKPLGAGLASRPLGGGVGSGFKFAPKQKKTALIDVQAVAQLNQAAQAERERKRREDEAAKEAAAKARADAKAQEKARKEQQREAAKAAKAEELIAKKEEEKAQREAEAQAAKEAAKAKKEEEKAQREADARAAKEAAKAQKESERAAQQAEAREAKAAAKQAAKEAAQLKKEAEKAQRKKRPAERETGEGGSTERRPPKMPKPSSQHMGSAADPQTSLSLLDPATASAALEQAAMLADVEAAGLTVDPDLLQYMQYAPDNYEFTALPPPSEDT